jgi:hypothetical protein
MTVAAGDAKAIAIYGALTRIVVPIFTTTGTVVTGGLTGLAATRSIDEATAAATTNTPTEIATNSGVVYLDLTAAEMTCNCLFISITATNSGAVPAVIVLYPQQLVSVRTGTAQAGANTTITLDASASAINGFYDGCYVQATNNTPTGIQNQVRKIVSYVGSTQVATIDSAWGNNPTSSTTFAILLPPGVVGQIPYNANVQQINGISAGSVTTVNANQGTVQPVHFTGTGASSLVQSDSIDIASILAVLDSNNFLKVDVAAVNADTTAPGNIANTFNGTGYVATTAPAQQQQVANIAITGSALNQVASSFVQTTGSVTSGTYANTATADGVYHITADAAGTLNEYYQFNVGTYGVGASVDFIGYLTSAVDSMKVYAYNWGNAAWDQIGTISGTTSIVVNNAEWDLTTAHTGTGGNLGLVQIRFGNTGLVSSSLGIDRLLVGYAQVQQFPANFSLLYIDANGGIDLGAIYGTAIDARFQRAVDSIVEVTVGSGSTTTNIVASATSPTTTVANQFARRVLTFDRNTTTANLRGQSTVVQSNDLSGNIVVEALTTAPVSGDTCTIS